jgi:CheY-like chemotaxis protein
MLLQHGICCRGSAMSDDRSVLFVEDEGLIRELNAEELAEAGFAVVVAESGDDALEALDGDAVQFGNMTDTCSGT